LVELCDHACPNPCAASVKGRRKYGRPLAMCSQGMGVSAARQASRPGRPVSPTSRADPPIRHFPWRRGRRRCGEAQPILAAREGTFDGGGFVGCLELGDESTAVARGARQRNRL
jgi:hypothetical protein